MQPWHPLDTLSTDWFAPGRKVLEIAGRPGVISPPETNVLTSPLPLSNVLGHKEFPFLQDHASGSS